MKNVIWLTGASTGIGAAFARRAAAAGHRLVLTARRRELLDSLRSELGPERVVVAAGDVTSFEDNTRAVQTALDSFGRLDVLVANAGTHVPTNFTALDVEEVRSLMDVNFLGAVSCISAVLPHFLSQRAGHIVGVSSVAAYRGLPGAASYCASKAALTAFLESIRFDLEPHSIEVSIVSPGFVDTPLTEKNDFVMPALMSAETAASRMLRGIEQRKFEIHFPKRFTLLMKLMRILPYPLYHSIVRRRTKGI